MKTLLVITPPYIDNKKNGLENQSVVKMKETYQEPQFRHEFHTFLNKKGLEWKASSPHYPQSNGLANGLDKKLKYLMARIMDTDGTLVIEKLNRMNQYIQHSKMLYELKID